MACKHIVVYSKELREKLLKLGYQEVKQPEPNLRDNKYLVWFFGIEAKEVIEKHKKCLCSDTVEKKKLLSEIRMLDI